MVSDLAQIPARSRRQAMDWALVLASQEIETTFDYSQDRNSWELTVPIRDYEKALEAIRLYKLENRRWPWRSEMFDAEFLFDWGALAWALLVSAFFWAQGRQPALHDAGVMLSDEVKRGQWWRLFTAVWLHADIAHLASNATLGLVLLGLALGRYGTGVGILAALLAGVGGNVASCLISPEPHASLGASGVVMGALGLLAARSPALWRHSPASRKQLLTAAAAGVMLFVLFGLTPGTDILAHFGGFMSGVFLGAILSQVPTPSRNATLNLLCGLVFASLVLWPWWLALKATK
jgi:membrane associated rhomboid family serine protease